jgi:inhibitor of KinA
MTNLPKPRFLPAGESALVAEFGTEIDPGIHDCVLALDAAIHQANWDGVTETVPTYRSLMIHFDPRRWTMAMLIEALTQLEHQSAKPRAPRARWHIPACYDPPHAEDLTAAAASLGMPAERVIELHLRACYRVYMYGFAPGWTFLGGLARELAIPRRAVPRPPVRPGALLIAGGQALIAGCAMPTGWYEIGRTPVSVYDPGRERVFLASIGDEICFHRVDPAEFDALRMVAGAGQLPARQEILNVP